MAKGSKNVFEELEYNVPVPFGGKITDLHRPHGKVKSSQRRLKVKGNIVSNQTPNASKTTVLNDSNDGKNSYQILSLFEPNTSILYIRLSDNLVTTVRELSFDGYFRGVYLTGLCE